MAIRLVISGACGRMGQTIARCALQDSLLTLGAVLEASQHAAVGRDYKEVLGQPLPAPLPVLDDARRAISQGDVVIEFTTPQATTAHVQVAAELGKAMVIGTTGLPEADRERIAAAAKAIPIVLSPNMSVGVNVLFELAQIATARLGPSYQVAITETHHQHKKDAPSGTAKRLQELIAKIRSQWRVPAEVPCESIRTGEVVGDHTVVFSSPFERLELTHHAETRDVFAVGALKAAQFVVGRPPGLYDMSDVLRST